jgi:hypothetical protein
MESNEFIEQYSRASEAERKQVRKALEAEVRAQLTRLYGRVWTKGKIAVRASKMVDMSMRAGKAALN